MIRAPFLLISILWCSLQVAALAPPHPDFVEWESVHKVRRRLNISYHYEPIHMSAEKCRYLTEEECKVEDDLAGEHRQKHLDRRERRLQASEGIFRVPVVLVRFTDHVDRILPSKEYMEDMFNGDGPGEASTVGSVKEWLRYNSLGRYRVSFEVHDWETTNNTEAFFARNRSGT